MELTELEDLRDNRDEARKRLYGVLMGLAMQLAIVLKKIEEGGTDD